MFEKILYPTDFSDVSKKALGYIKQLKDSGVKEVIVLHVIDRRADDAVHRYLDDQKFQELKRRKLEETKESLGGIEKELKQVGLKIKSRIEVGIPVRDILRVEEDEKVSAVVIGSHGISNLAEIFLGSVSEKVIRRCKTPVLVIKR